MKSRGAIGTQGRQPIAPPRRVKAALTHCKPHQQADFPVIPVPAFPPLPVQEGIFFGFLKLFALGREPIGGDPVRLLGRRVIHMPWSASKADTTAEPPVLQPGAQLLPMVSPLASFSTPLQPGTDFPLCRVFLFRFSRRWPRASGGSRLGSRAHRKWPSRPRRYRRPLLRCRRCCRR